MTPERHYRRRLLTWCLGILLGAGTVAPVHAEVELGPTVVLSSRSTNNHHPVLAASSSGEYTFAAWDGEVQGHRRIVVREAYLGEWLPEVIVDDSPLAENTRPTIDVSDDGTPHLAWLAREGGRVLPHYATRVAGQWVQIALAGNTTAGDCDYVTLKLDQDGRPWIAWQVGQGSAYEVFVASPTAEGGFRADCLTPGANSHNLFPEIFFDPDPVVAWYADREDQTYLVGERFSPETESWGEALVANLENLPTEPVPQLVSRSSGPLAALWYERAVTRSGEISATDRVLMGEQGAETRGAGVVIDQQPDANNRLVAGAAVGGSIVAAWCSDGVNGETRIVLGHGRTASGVENAFVSTGEIRNATNPKVSAIGMDAGVAWESNAAAGGDGGIYFRHVDLD